MREVARQFGLEACTTFRSSPKVLRSEVPREFPFDGGKSESDDDVLHALRSHAFRTLQKGSAFLFVVEFVEIGGVRNRIPPPMRVN